MVSYKRETPAGVGTDRQATVLMSIISQLRPGADLSRITLPTFILEPKSMLERITNFMQHPENLIPITAIEDPEERFLQVVKFYLSGWHIKPAGVKKPLNPILGEYHTCYWDLQSGHRSFYIAEQTSHHPPKSSYFYMSPEHHIRIDGTLKPQSRFLGNSAASMMNTSLVALRLLNRGATAGKPGGGERYLLTQPNMYVRGILFGKMKYELGDHSYVKCPELDLVCDIEFKVKGFFTGAYNAIGGFIKRESTGEQLYEISGSWHSEMFIKNLLTGKRELLFDATHARPTPPIVKPLEEQDERESQRLWHPTVSALNKRDQEGATDEKFKVEDRQREEARTREADGVEWTPRFFRPVDPARGEEEGLDWVLSAHIDDEASPEEQIKQIMSVAPILAGSRRNSKFEIPPHHPQHEHNHAETSSTTAPANPVHSDADLIDFKGPTEGKLPGELPALVPTQIGVAPAGRMSALDDMSTLQAAVPSGKPRKAVSVASDDDFQDANES
ncbi:hypothetical protein EDC01DRAFT_620859 [Geopyxis carbonaria]|nr:hypothetical protein EDC01DRAFT_620859 [Geopyxis carbonaria]